MLRLEPARLVWTFHKMTKGKWGLFQFLFLPNENDWKIHVVCLPIQEQRCIVYLRVGLHDIQEYICIHCSCSFVCIAYIYVYVCILNVYLYIHMFILLYPIIPMGRRLFQKRIMQDPLSHSMSFMEETGSRSVMGLTKEAYTHVHGVRLCESSYCMKIVYIHMFNMYS